jgi:hypothetical protein
LKETSVTRRETHQFDLFPKADSSPPLPTAVEEAAFALLVQWLQTMIPILAREESDEQDHS